MYMYLLRVRAYMYKLKIYRVLVFVLVSPEDSRNRYQIFRRRTVMTRKEIEKNTYVTYNINADAVCQFASSFARLPLALPLRSRPPPLHCSTRTPAQYFDTRFITVPRRSASGQQWPDSPWRFFGTRNRIVIVIRTTFSFLEHRSRTLGK